MAETGRFITFEGGEGAGKSTQIARLAAALSDIGIRVDTTREPGGSPGAETIRQLLLDPDATWTPQAECLLHFGARADHYTTRIAPALKAGTWILCDRFADSTRAYQGYGLGVDLDAIEILYEFSLGDFRPDLTLILDVSVQTGVDRLAVRSGDADRYERMDRDFHERLRRGFLDIAAAEPGRCVVIDAERDVDTVASEILSAVRARLEPVAAA
jgi:dTMP kinase